MLIQIIQEDDDNEDGESDNDDDHHDDDDGDRDNDDDVGEDGRGGHRAPIARCRVLECQVVSGRLSVII